MDNKQIEGNIFVPAHIDDVWRAWTTESGLRSFLAPECLMVPEPNGPFEIYFRPDAPLGERGSEGCRVMAVMPHDLLSFSWNFPPSLPHIRLQKTQVSLRFVPEGASTSCKAAGQTIPTGIRATPIFGKSGWKPACPACSIASPTAPSTGITRRTSSN